MPFRSPKMNGFIFGFQRFVWCPKWTPASRRSFIAIAFKLGLLLSSAGPKTSGPSLTFAELEALARASHAVFLSFLRAWIARHQPDFTEPRPQVCVVFDERPRDAEPQRAGLSRNAAASSRREHVEAIQRLGYDERL